MACMAGNVTPYTRGRDIINDKTDELTHAYLKILLIKLARIVVRLLAALHANHCGRKNAKERR